MARLRRKTRMDDFAGILTDAEARELEANIKKGRKLSAIRMSRIRKRLMNDSGMAR